MVTGIFLLGAVNVCTVLSTPHLLATIYFAGGLSKPVMPDPSTLAVTLTTTITSALTIALLTGTLSSELTTTLNLALVVAT